MIDRNARARAMHHAEALDRRTRLPGQHGGVLKRAGLAVLKALLFQFANVATGRCDPGYDRIAEVAGVARSTVAVALRRLEAAGLLERVRRQVGAVRYSNAYRFVLAGDARSGPPGLSDSAKSGFRAQTTNQQKTYPKSARSVPAAPTWPADISREDARRGLEQAKAPILRRAREREERERRARRARPRGAPAAPAP